MSNKEYQTSHYKKNRLLSKCNQCGHSCETGKARCNNCSQIISKKTKELRAFRIENQLCTTCGISLTVTKYHTCQDCRNKSVSKVTNKNKERKNLGVCITCGKDSQFKTYCPQCAKIRSNNSSLRKKRKIQEGYCRCCEKNKATIKTLCVNCWYKDKAYDNCNDRTKWKELKYLIEQQNYKCSYTGITLIPGVNASIDHIIPRSLGGSNELSNLQWVDLSINKMKADILPERFLELINLIKTKY